MTGVNLEESLSMFMAEIAKRLDENTNLIKELQAFTDFALRNQEASIKALKIQVRQISIELHEKLSGDLESSTIIKPRVDDDTISTSVETIMPLIRHIDVANTSTVKRPKGIVENVLVGIDKFTFPINFIILDILEEFKTPLILGRPFLSTAHNIINMFKAKITLSVRNDKIFFKSNKPTSDIIKRVYALSLIESTELVLEASLMGNALRKNRPHDSKFKDFIKRNDLNKPIEYRRNQVKVFIPTIDEGEERAKEYYECMEPFKSLMCLWVRSKSIAAIWLEKVVTPLIEPTIKGFAAAPAVLKLKRLKVDKT
nr:hypothetical protein [Tanacetum cinerariifolium]